MRELRLGYILELGSLELCQALFSLLFEFPILDGDSRHDFQLFDDFLDSQLQQMTILGVELFFEEARIVEFECMWSLAERLGDGHGDSFQVHAQALLACPLLDLYLEIPEVGLLALDVVIHVPKMVLEIVNVHVYREEGVGWNDCFNF